MSAKQPKATCRLCEREFAQRGVTRHLSNCLTSQPDTGAESAAQTLFHIKIAGRYHPDYWLHLELPGRATFAVLDAFLRTLWLECCGHLSAFRFPEPRNQMRGPFDFSWDWMDDSPEDELMKQTLEEKLSVGMSFDYEYDFGSTTALSCKVLHVRRGTPSGEPLAILARNPPVRIPCSYCGKKEAQEVCVDCRWEGTGWACKSCMKKHTCGEDMWLPVVDSPRMGVCGFTGGESEEVALAHAQRLMPKRATSPRKHGHSKGLVPAKDQAKHKEVEALLKKRMKATHTASELQMALGFWQVFVAQESPQISSAAGYAAALEYIIAIETEDDDVTQGQLAKKYKTSTATISKNYRRIDDALGLFERDDIGFHSDIGTAFSRSGGDSPLAFFNQILSEELPPGAEQLLEFIADSFGADAEELDLFLEDEEEELLQSLALLDETWVGFCHTLEPPADSPIPLAPTVCFWTTESGYPLLGQELILDGDKAQALMDLMVQTMASPLSGAPGRRRVLLPHQEYVEPFREVLAPFGIQVSHGAEALQKGLGELLERSLEGPLPPSISSWEADEVLVSSMFAACGALYEEAPWRRLEDSQPLQVDLRSWGLGCYCVSVMGAAKAALGLLIFESHDDFSHFQKISHQSQMKGRLPDGFGVSFWSLTFEASHLLPKKSHRKYQKQGWDIAGHDVYPDVDRRDENLRTHPLAERDMLILAGCAWAAAAYAREHGDQMQRVTNLMIISDDIELVPPISMKAHVQPLPKHPPIEVTLPHPERLTAMKALGFGK